MPTEPRSASERYLYWGGVLAGLGLGLVVGYGLHSEGYLGGKGVHLFVSIPSGLAIILGHLIANRGRRAKRETD
jgi:hypothetical protein